MAPDVSGAPHSPNHYNIIRWLLYTSTDLANTIKMETENGEREAGNAFQYCERPVLRTRMEQIAFKWYMLRFPKRYFDASYFAEWVSRFESGEPWVYMDSESLEIYRGLADK